MSKLYVNKEYLEDFSKEIMEDTQVATLDNEEGYIIVNEDYKEEFNQKYHIELVELEKWLEGKYDYSAVAELIYEIQEVEDSLSDCWEQKTLTDFYGKRVIQKGFKLLFSKNDSEIIDHILNREKLDSLFKGLLKPIMVKEAVDWHKEKIKQLKACL